MSNLSQKTNPAQFPENIIPFPSKDGKIAITIPANFPPDNQLGILTNRGDSLIYLGILDGDQILVDKSDNDKELTGSGLYAILYHGDLLAKILYPISKTRVLLRGAGPGCEDLEVDRSDVQIRGRVVLMQRTIVQSL